MNDEEVATLFDSLVDEFSGAGLGWIVDEVRVLISQGAEERVNPVEWNGIGKLSKSEDRFTRRRYTNRERVLLLVEAVERVAVDGFEIEKSVAAFFTESDSRPSVPQVVQFRPESDQADSGERFDLRPASAIASREAAIATLVEELRKVRSEVAQ